MEMLGGNHPAPPNPAPQPTDASQRATEHFLPFSTMNPLILWYKQPMTANVCPKQAELHWKKAPPVPKSRLPEAAAEALEGGPPVQGH